MSDQIRESVFQLVALAGVSFVAEYRGEKKNALNSSRPMDQWLCVFTHANGSEEFDYFTGLGLRTPAPHPAGGRPIAPHVAGVLQCLLRDSEAVGQSFDSWCDEFGYDNDSRKAYATYEDCQKIGDQLRRLFTHAQREELQTALQDY